MTYAEDLSFMKQALALAEQGTGLASPGARVGAILVKDGRILGQGFYRYDDVDHAEIQALDMAGPAAKGATLFTSLEPCSHVGRTPPCSTALIEAGVSRVVAAIEDQNPQVQGAGCRMLRAAGVDVECGLLGDEARRLNEAFFAFKREHRPFGILKIAMTLDGKIATASGESKWITGEDARSEVQNLRHSVDAIVTGSGTVLKDDPQLTDRTGKPRRRALLRVVLDRRGRLHDGLALWDLGPALVITENPNLNLKRAEVLHSSGGLKDLMHTLYLREIQSFMMECGPDLAYSALMEGMIDKVIAFVAPRIIGGQELSAVGGAGAPTLQQALRLEPLEVRRIGQDHVWTGYVHRNH